MKMKKKKKYTNYWMSLSADSLLQLIFGLWIIKILLIVHYVTDEWGLKKKIYAHKSIEYPHGGETLFGFVKQQI